METVGTSLCVLWNLFSNTLIANFMGELVIGTYCQMCFFFFPVAVPGYIVVRTKTVVRIAYKPLIADAFLCAKMLIEALPDHLFLFFKSKDDQQADFNASDA